MRDYLFFSYRAAPNYEYIWNNTEINKNKFYDEIVVKDPNGNNCMHLKWYQDERIIVVDSLKYSERKNELNCTTSGVELLNRAKMFVLSGIVDKVILSDDSYISHADVHKRVPLKTVRTFLIGNSWYEEHGFEYEDYDRKKKAQEEMDKMKDFDKFIVKALGIRLPPTLKTYLDEILERYITIEIDSVMNRYKIKKKFNYNKSTIINLFGKEKIESLKDLDHDRLLLLSYVLNSLDPRLPLRLVFKKI